MADRKPIFDLVRKLLGRGFRQSEIAKLDAAIDAAFADPIELTPAKAMQVSKAGVDLIKEFEGCARVREDGMVEAYPDPGSGGDPWTIGWGATGPDIGPGTVWTQAQCDARLLKDVERHAQDVRAFIGSTPTTQGQFDAMVSFHYNTGDLPRSTLGRKHRGKDYAGAAAEFPKWKFASGRVLKGLVRRRAAERALYEG